MTRDVEHDEFDSYGNADWYRGCAALVAVAPVTELLLYRDPSRSFGTPTPAECDTAAHVLTRAVGGSATLERAQTAGVLVGLGLREGYAPDAPEHQPEEVEAPPRQHRAGRRLVRGGH